MYIQDVGLMHEQQVASGQDKLYQEFGIAVQHFRNEHSFYKRVKEELVTGFNGEETDSNVALVTIYLITNYLAFQVLVAFLMSHSALFREMRTEIYESRWKILLCSMFDITCSVVPVVCVIADDDKAHLYHVGALCLIAALMSIHVATGRQAEDPIFSQWFLPGGKNDHRGLYTVETKTVKVKSVAEAKPATKTYQSIIVDIYDQ